MKQADHELPRHQPLRLVPTWTGSLPLDPLNVLATNQLQISSSAMPIMEEHSALLRQVKVLMLFLLASSSAAFPAQPAMERLRWQVDRVNRRGPSLGLVMSYVDEATALQSSGYFSPWPVLPFIDLYGKSGPSIPNPYTYLDHRAYTGHIYDCISQLIFSSSAATITAAS